ncbi:MAG TPA: hypothetical protein VM347_40005 [Nonomuraea sp.]|nr:hypothetical protein [Nonomuraea sp.]
MLAFALAYGVFVEAFDFQTLWNPHYEGLRILDYGFIPALGTAPPWFMFMVGVHTVWSISVPIAIAESLASSRRTTPWLGTPGLIVAAVLFVLGAGMVILSTIPRAGNLLTAPRLIAALIVIGALLALGWHLGRIPPG